MELTNNDVIMDKKNYMLIKFDKHDIKKIYIAFISVLFDYLHTFKHNIIEKKGNYSIKVIKKGISMLKHVMNVLFLYTRNTELIYKHLNKSFLYYIEFIEQIGEEGNTFLQLSSKDAMLFVYKKTIFDINIEYKKKMEYSEIESKTIDTILENLNLFIFIAEYSLFADITDFKDVDIEFFRKKIIKLIEKYMKKTHPHLNEMIQDIFNFLIANKIETPMIIQTIEYFIQKIDNINYELFKKNLMRVSMKNTFNRIKFVNSLLN
jgi:hypothetical protein